MLTPHLTSLTPRGHACFLASHLKFSYSTLYVAEIVYGHNFGPVLHCGFESHQGRFCMHTDVYTHTHTHTYTPLGTSGNVWRHFWLYKWGEAREAAKHTAIHRMTSPLPTPTRSPTKNYPTQNVNTAEVEKHPIQRRSTPGKGEPQNRGQSLKTAIHLMCRSRHAWTRFVCSRAPAAELRSCDRPVSWQSLKYVLSGPWKETSAKLYVNGAARQAGVAVTEQATWGGARWNQSGGSRQITEAPQANRSCWDTESVLFCTAHQRSP